MKATHWHRLSIVVPLVFVSCLINGVDPLLTTRPSNVVTEAGENVTLECSSDQANAIRWLYDGAFVTGLGCSPSSANYLTVSSTQNECNLIILSSSTAVLGPYACGDGTTAQAVVILIDPKPTCGVVGIPMRGENATLSCVTTYRRLPEVVAVIPGAGFSAAISWDSAAGTSLRTSSTKLKSTDGNMNVGETLEVDVLTFAGGTEIPSYNCTTLFNFTDRVSALLSYAHNDLSWTCVSAPVLTWYCPMSVNVTPPSESAFRAGDVLTCMSDGYPEPTLMWTDGSAASTTTVPKGWFNVTCAATGNFTTPCTAMDTITGFGVACPETLTVSPWSSPEVMVNTTLTCSATGAAPEPTIFWLNGSTVVSTDAMITVTEPGPFQLTCVANSSFNGIECYNTTDVIGAAVQNLTETTPTTPTTSTTATTTATTASMTGSTTANTATMEISTNNAVVTGDVTVSNTTTLGDLAVPIVFAFLSLIATIWLTCLLTFWDKIIQPETISATPTKGETPKQVRRSRFPPVSSKRPFYSQPNTPSSYAPGSILKY